MSGWVPGRLLAVIVGVLALMGVAAWWTMPRQEDPSLPARWGQVTVTFWGADAAAVERLVLNPVERELAGVEQLGRIFARAAPGGAVLALELEPDVEDIGATWDRVDEALGRAEREFPTGVESPQLDRDTNDQDAIVLAVVGSDDNLTLRRAAHELRRQLLMSADVSQVRIIGDPGEQVTVQWDPDQAAAVGLSTTMLAAQLRARHTTPVAGVVDIGTKRATVRATAEFRDIAEIRDTPISVPGGSTVSLDALADIQATTLSPPRERARIGGRPAVMLGIVLRPKVDVVAAGQRVMEHLRAVESAVAPLRVEPVFYQPSHVEERLSGLAQSLGLGIVIVTFTLIVAMGLRIGLVVGAIVPSIALVSLTCYALVGGTLHQVSIAAFVISLGILVDNAIVMAESVQAGLDTGLSAARSVSLATRELVVPLGAATGTTLAGFLPIAFSSGATADFIRDLPIVLLISLTLSYVFAIVVAPALCGRLLRRRPADRRGPSTLEQVSEGVGRIAWRRPWLIVMTTVAAVCVAGLAASRVDSEFFPESDRAVLVVDLTQSEGTRFEVVDDLARRVDQEIRSLDDGLKTSTYVGRGAPHFYYNLSQSLNSPHRAQIVVESTNRKQLPLLADKIRSLGAQPWLAGTQLVVSPLRQGPPVTAPVEVLVQHGSPEALIQAADTVRALLTSIPGAIEVRTDAGLGAPVVSFAIDPPAAARAGTSPTQIAETIRAQTLGVPVGELRSGTDAIPIVVRGGAATKTPVTLMGTGVPATTGVVPLALVGELDVQWRPAVIRHRDRAPSVSVLAGVAPGHSAAAVRQALELQLDELSLPPGVTVAFEGEAEESAKANRSLGRSAPLGVAVLVGFLVATFNSFRRTVIVLTTVPLAIAGVVPGLLIGQQAFGFMALLGVIALVGIVVNNAIVLIDRIDRLRRQGLDAQTAVRNAVRSRIRPILLTTLTTVAGLVPLALSSSRLWPPLAWPMMTGLVASTALTLLVTPALYTLTCTPRSARTPRGGDGQPT